MTGRVSPVVAAVTARLASAIAWLTGLFRPGAGRLDLAAGFRLACAFIAPIAVGAAVHRPLEGVFVGIGAFIVANADLGGAYGGRARLMLLTAAGTTASVLLGMVCSSHRGVAVPAAASVLFVAGLVAVVSTEASLLGTFVSFGYVIGLGAGTAALSLPVAGALLLAGGAFALALTLWAWPLRPDGPLLAALDSAETAVGAYLVELADGTPPATAQRSRAIAALQRARSAVEAARSRVTPLAADRLVRAGAAFDEGAAAAAGPPEDLLQERLRELAGALAESPDPDRDPEDIRPLLPGAQTDGWSRGWELVRAQLDPRSAALRHAVRLTLAGTLALLVVPRVDNHNGAWLVTGALIVLKPDFGATLRTTSQRGAGTVVGALLAGALAALTHQPAILLAAAFCLTWLGESLIGISFGLFAVFITPLSVLIGNVLVPGDWQIAITRTVDVAIGCAIAVAVSVLVPPSWVRERMDTAIAEADAAVDRLFDALETDGAEAADEAGAADEVDAVDEAALHRLRSTAELLLANARVLLLRLESDPPSRRGPVEDYRDALDHLAGRLDSCAALQAARAASVRRAGPASPRG